MTCLRPVLLSVSTEAPETSAPVPAVVGTRTSGTVGSSSGVAPPTKRAIEPPCETTMRAAFARSSAEPPPMPTMASPPVERASSANSSVAASEGSPGALTWRVMAMPAASQAASASTTAGASATGASHQHRRGPHAGLAEHARQLADRAVAERDADGQVRGERVDVGERHGRGSGSGADSGLRESRAVRQPPSAAPSGSGSSAPARSQRAISQPLMRLNCASIAMSWKRPSISATAGPPYCSVHI